MERRRRRRFPSMLVFTVTMITLIITCGIIFDKSGNNAFLDVTAELLEQQDKETAVTTTAPVPKTTETTTTTVTTKEPTGHVIPNMPTLFQAPELPTGCEISAFTIVLHYYGCDVDKVKMAMEYMPRVEYYCEYDDDGRLVGADFENYFMGDPSTKDGFVCGPPAVVKAGNAYFADAGLDLEAVDITGVDPEVLYKYLDENTPICMWVTVNMADRMETEGWYTEYGDYIEWSKNDHGSTLVGYSDDTVTFSDPMSGELVEFDRDQFERVYEQRDRKAVIVRRKKH